MPISASTTNPTQLNNQTAVAHVPAPVGVLTDSCAGPMGSFTASSMVIARASSACRRGLGGSGPRLSSVDRMRSPVRCQGHAAAARISEVRGSTPAGGRSRSGGFDRVGMRVRQPCPRPPVSVHRDLHRRPLPGPLDSGPRPTRRSAAACARGRDDHLLLPCIWCGRGRSSIGSVSFDQQSTDATAARWRGGGRAPLRAALRPRQRAAGRPLTPLGRGSKGPRQVDRRPPRIKGARGERRCGNRAGMQGQQLEPDPPAIRAARRRRRTGCSASSTPACRN